MPKQYDASTIEVSQNLDHIRRRPTAYIGDRGVNGQVHMIREWVDNAVDEETLKPNGGLIYIGLFRDRGANKYQIVITDHGRGIPSESLLNVVTVLGTSGKMGDNSAYVSSGGMFGIGGKVAAALSRKFCALSKNYLENVASRVYLNDGTVIAHDIQELDRTQGYIPGTIIVFEPDITNFFSDGTEFMESGYLDLVAVCKQLNIFNEKIVFKFVVFERSIPNNFWNKPVLEAMNRIYEFFNSKHGTVEYDSTAVRDKSAYLFEIWKLNSSITHQESIEIASDDPTDRLRFAYKLFIVKKSNTNSAQYFITINNVSLVDKTENSATVTFMRLFRNKLAERVEDNRYKEFILNEYRFPVLMLAIGVKFNKAELSGTTKVSFKDPIFVQMFEERLGNHFNAQTDEYWDHIYNCFKSDIELRYNQYYDTPVKKSDAKRVFIELNFPSSYKECKSSERDKCELYIVEGTSAGNINSTRNNIYQAVYETRGKPVNGAATTGDMIKCRKRLTEDPIYKDILKILGIGPNTTDMNNSRFGKIIIATDADADGMHIRALHLHNLYLINPRIVESGMVWLANPPLYSLELSKNRQLYLRDKVALTDARIEYLYKPSLDITVVSKAGKIKPDDKLYREICYLINYIGEQFTTIAAQLNIPLLILERLVWATPYLYPVIQYDKLTNFFMTDDEDDFVRVRITPEEKFIVVSLGHDDYPIGLDSVGELIRNHLVPLMKKYKVDELLFEVITKKANSGFHTRAITMSAMMLYICFRKLDELFKIRRYKGLGQLSESGCATTIMDPETRSLTQVTSVGDELSNSLMLGRDTITRKQLLTDTGELASFQFDAK